MRKPSVERCYVTIIRSIIVVCCYHFWSEIIAIGLLALYSFSEIESIKANIGRYM